MPNKNKNKKQAFVKSCQFSAKPGEIYLLHKVQAMEDAHTARGVVHERRRGGGRDAAAQWRKLEIQGLERLVGESTDLRDAALPTVAKARRRRRREPCILSVQWVLKQKNLQEQFLFFEMEPRGCYDN
jgi:hypothetical protein